jgi:REP element-mobilizing transposase RayT
LYTNLQQPAILENATFILLLVFNLNLYPLTIIINVLYNQPMKKSNEFRTGRHCVFNMHVHLVFVTKYRKNIFNQSILDELKDIFIDICNSFEASLIEFDGEEDDLPLMSQLDFSAEQEVAMDSDLLVTWICLTNTRGRTWRSEHDLRFSE